MSDFKAELRAWLDELAVALAGHDHQWTQEDIFIALL